MKLYRSCLKRLLDLVIVLGILLLIGWIIAVIAIWLHFANKGAGAFYHSERVGRGERLFNFYKFKSMTDERDADGNLLPDKDRLTKVGRFIRSTSIDELPQLLNVLKGDMSLVGPRPLPPEYLPYYTESESIRHNVRPGITGWAQVNGRKNITWDHKLECDVFYVNNLSFGLDCKVIWLTAMQVIKKEGVGVESSGMVSLYDVRGVQRPEYRQYDR